MNLHFLRQPLRGEMTVLPSKSISHRALICAALAQGESLVTPLQGSEDIRATMRALQGLGIARVLQTQPLDADGFVACRMLGGLGPQGETLRQVDCGESGSTLRFLIPLALDGRGAVVFRGQGRLMQRPLTAYAQLFAQKGMLWQQAGDTLTVAGKLVSGEYALPGDVSSQFITGLLYALPGLAGDSKIRLTTPLESRGYVELTLEALKNAGVHAAFVDAQTIEVPGGQTFRPGAYTVSGDWSHAAFYLVAGALGGEVLLRGLDMNSKQGDRAIVALLRRMGARIELAAEGVRATAGRLRGIDIDASDIPDLVPILSVAACAAQGITRIHGAARLRLKESDRLAAMCAELRKLGAAVQELPDGLRITGGTPLRFAQVSGHNDHRIVMSLAVCAALCEGGLSIEGVEAAAKSAPRFLAEYEALGGRQYARDVGE